MSSEYELFHGKYRTRSNRLKNWDYSQSAAYFITICTKDRLHSLGEIINGILAENEASRICKEYWLDIPKHGPFILDAFVIMPNHIHGIIFIENISVETIHELSLRRNNRRNMLISRAVGRFKMQTAKRINEYKSSIGQPFWQRNYYDHIIRSEEDLNRIREYIFNNPSNWDKDTENTQLKN